MSLITTHTELKSQEASLYSRYPLDLDTDQVRLIEVQHTAWNEPVHCSMRVVSLEDAPEFRALSYVWGDPEPRQQIHVDNQILTVNPNLFDALRRLRMRYPQWADRNLVIWIDALCIDQRNTAERGHQVTMMKRIYESCIEVIIWLGDIDRERAPSTDVVASDEEYRAPTREPHVAGCQCQDADWERSADLSWSGIPTRASWMALSVLNRMLVLKRCEELQPCRLFMNLDEMIAFRYFMKYLLNNLWFTRIWVVQEFVLAPKVSVSIGSILMPMNLLFGGAVIWCMHSTRMCCPMLSKKLLEFEPVINTLQALCSIRHLSQSAFEFDFFTLRPNLIGKRATLDHDLVYGLLGLIDSESSALVIPAYDRSVEEVYTEFSRGYFQSSKSNDYQLFAAFAFASAKSRYPNLPSWVIDHTTFEDSSQSSLATFYAAYSAFSLPLPSDLETRHNRTFSVDHLILHGHFVDSLDIVGQANMDAPDPLSHDDNRYGVLNEWRTAVLARHLPNDPYLLPHGYNSVGDNWATAWLKLLCMSHRLRSDEGVSRLTDEETATVLADAPSDPSTYFVLDQTPIFRGQLNDSDVASVLEHMERPDLIIQIWSLVIMVTYRSRMFLTESGYLGFGNINIKRGDRIFLSSPGGQPVILQSVESSMQKLGRTTYRVVSSCYLHGFMDGPDEGAEFSCEEVWIE